MDKARMHDLVSKLKDLAKKLNKSPTKVEFINSGISHHSVSQAGGYLKLLDLAGLQSVKFKEPKVLTEIKKPKILVLDIETLPMIVYSWDLWPENIGLDMVIEDWSIASWAAKWLGEDEIIYFDVRKNKNLRNDKAICQKMWKLLDEADIVVTQNGISFDIKKLFARFFKHEFKPPSSFRHYDTKIIAKRYFKFSSNRLAFMTDEFNKLYKKLDHAQFAGFKLWKACMKKDMKAWAEMETYNKHDVFALEELFMMLLPWDKSINWNVYHDGSECICSCGSDEFFIHPKAKHTTVGRYIRIICQKCGKEHFTKDNLLSKDKRKNLLR